MYIIILFLTAKVYEVLARHGSSIGYCWIYYNSGEWSANPEIQCCQKIFRRQGGENDRLEWTNVGIISVQFLRLFVLK